MSRTLILALVLSAAATAAHAQAWSPSLGHGATATDPHRYQVEQSRLETERLRLQADQRELAARQQQIEARLTRQRIEARRQPDLIPPPVYRPLRSPEEERAWRESATQRRQSTQAGVGQIDAWLDRKSD